MGRWARHVAILSVLGFLGLGGAFAVFIIRFDPDPYRSYLESQFSKVLRLKVELGHLSRSWKQGLGVKVEGVRLQKGEEEPPLFVADSLLVWLDSLSLAGGRLVYKVKVDEGHLHYRDWDLRGIYAEVRQEITGGPVKGAGEGRILSNSTSDITAQGRADTKTGEIDFDVRFQDRKMALQGEVLLFQKPPRFQAHLELEQLDLETIFRLCGLRGPVNEAVAGSVSGNFEGAGVGLEGSEIQKTLQGKGKLEIRDGVFRNVNVVNTILKRITVVPALGEVLIAGIPPYFQPLLNRRDTPFELLQVQFEIREGEVSFQQFLVKDRHYLVEAVGTLNLQGEVNFQAKLVLMGELSQFLVGRVRELSSLRNVQGRIVIPFVYRGNWSATRPRPDLSYLAERLLLDRGTRLLEKGLEAIMKKEKKE